jgi:hypothetical protein
MDGWSSETVAATVVDLLSRSRLPFGDERGVQDVVERRLIAGGLAYHREYDLGPAGRIDFLIPTGWLVPRGEGARTVARPVGVGLELKVKGGPSAVWAQCARYAEHPQIESLILVTARRQAAEYVRRTSDINGTPIRVLSVWRGGL